MAGKDDERCQRIGSEAATRFYEAIRGESDRGCVLVSATLLDTSLELLLRTAFEQMSGGAADKRAMDFLLVRRPLPPLGSLGVRIEVAHVLGLIPRELRASLRQVQLVRNRMAHHFKPGALTDDMVGKLFATAIPENIRSSIHVPSGPWVACKGAVVHQINEEEVHRSGGRVYSIARFRFMEAVKWLAMELDQLRLEAQKLPASNMNQRRWLSMP